MGKTLLKANSGGRPAVGSSCNPLQERQEAYMFSRARLCIRRAYSPAPRRPVHCITTATRHWLRTRSLSH
ncbi:hypothetical protein BDW02DRAFT_241655 [Decorospora gaudefroyi]|uniref:Uncharacterized protein n=1 Tax=Decorospora gaudefroyi TaxID=184978 RepID=A0A6A5KGV8_9PLEO|nr:hypothetical protein BDW02DRAFT_241655 [Decorospora gaudefroyi]